MIKSLLIIVAIGGSSFYYTDIESSSSFFSLFLPVINFFVLLALAFWLVALFHQAGINQTSRSSGDSGIGGDFFGGGGDSGGSGDC